MNYLSHLREHTTNWQPKPHFTGNPVLSPQIKNKQGYLVLFLYNLELRTPDIVIFQEKHKFKTDKMYLYDMTICVENPNENNKMLPQ